MVSYRWEVEHEYSHFNIKLRANINCGTLGWVNGHNSVSNWMMDALTTTPLGPEACDHEITLLVEEREEKRGGGVQERVRKCEGGDRERKGYIWNRNRELYVSQLLVLYNRFKASLIVLVVSYCILMVGAPSKWNNHKVKEGAISIIIKKVRGKTIAGKWSVVWLYITLKNLFMAFKLQNPKETWPWEQIKRTKTHKLT